MKKLLVICGGQSTEHLISRMSCQSVMNNLDRSKYQISLVGISLEGDWYLLEQNKLDLPGDKWLENSKVIKEIISFIQEHDVILPILHGKYGEDGSIQGLFEMSGVPYVGCRVLGSALAMDKVFAKKIFDSAGIKQVPSIYVKQRFDGKLVAIKDDMSESENINDLVETSFGFPCFVKASNSGSSLGCYRVDSKEDLMDKLIEASKHDRKILIEQAIDCWELEVAVLGIDDVIASRVGQIRPHGDFYTFESKYYDKESSTIIPALVDDKIQEEIRKNAIKAFKAIDGFGLSRVDFFYDKKTNQVYLNEINTLPGFTNISMYPELMADSNISYKELLNRLIDLAI